MSILNRVSARDMFAIIHRQRLKREIVYEKLDSCACDPGLAEIGVLQSDFAFDEYLDFVIVQALVSDDAEGSEGWGEDAGSSVENSAEDGGTGGQSEAVFEGEGFKGRRVLDDGGGLGVVDVEGFSIEEFVEEGRCEWVEIAQVQ